MTEAMKPCPFCGVTPPGDSFHADQGNKWGRVVCGCGACGPDVRTSYDVSKHAPWHAAAIAEWNSRAVDRRRVVQSREIADLIVMVGHAITRLHTAEDSLQCLLQDILAAPDGEKKQHG
jgi:hypothetical protein